MLQAFILYSLSHTYNIYSSCIPLPSLSQKIIIINSESVLTQISTEIYSPYCSILCCSLQLFIISPIIKFCQHIISSSSPSLTLSFLSFVTSVGSFFSKCGQSILILIFCVALIIFISSFILLSTSSFITFSFQFWFLNFVEYDYA